jgi:hypothetical protein
MDTRISGIIGVVCLLGGLAGLGVFLQSKSSGVASKLEPATVEAQPIRVKEQDTDDTSQSLRRYEDGEHVYAAAQSVIVETGNTCSRAVDVFLVTDTPSSQGFILKVVCAGGSQYQITNVGGRVFVKPWSGDVFSR